VQAFVTAYNALVTFIGEQRSASAGGNGAAIGRDPMLRQLHSGLRGILTGAHGSGSLTRLAEVGVEFQSSGQLKLNDQAFDDAVTTDADGVQDLFAGAAGAFVEVGSLVNGYAQADGVIPAGKKRLESQINLMDAQIEAMQRRLAIERESLLRQFAEADAVMSRLNSQAGSLAQLGAGLNSNSNFSS
jgi:flagellar hook-associated protein 2